MGRAQPLEPGPEPRATMGPVPGRLQKGYVDFNMPWTVDFNMPWPVDYNRQFNTP